MNIALWLERAGKSHPNLPAVALGGSAVRDYGTLAMRAARLAGALRALCGLDAGDRVAIVAKNCLEYVEIMHGVWHAGLAAVPANAKLHGAELGYILEHSGARVCFAPPGLAAAIAPFAPPHLERLISIGLADYQRLFAAESIPIVPRAAGDLAWLFYSSGTTGRPKGVMLTHGVLSIVSHAYAAEVDQIVPGDAILHAAPMSHGSGLYMMAHVARLGINVVPESGGFDPAEIFGLIDHWPRSSMFAAPTMVKRLVAAQSDCCPSHIRTLIWGGAPMYEEDALSALERFGPRSAQIYGQAESPMTITTLSKQDLADRDDPSWRARLCSAGRPFACVEVSVAGEDGLPVPVGETGEVLCRGASVMPGYWQDPRASAEVLRDGWLHTGDLGALDSSGYLTLKDRSKDVVISGGSNIYPREVEEVLLRHPNVREVSVIGRSDREWGEVVVAYVVGQAPAAELDALCLGAIARFKRPKDYVFVETLPKNSYGKILKTELRALDTKRETRDG
ncbi:MAG: AMP-binding protein [Acetobacteraceae bacterium]